MKKRKVDIYTRGISGAEVCRRVIAHKIFTDVRYGWDGGQPGVHFWIVRDGFRAFLSRSSVPIGYSDGYDAAYSATRENPTRLTGLSVSRVKFDHVHAPITGKVGEWDSGQRAYKAGHNFEKDAKKDQVFAKFLEDILNIFNSAECPLSKKTS